MQQQAWAAGVLRLKRRTRIRYTDSQKALMWDRWQKGESLHQIARLFDRHHSCAGSLPRPAASGRLLDALE
jgi:hypothetical protein